VERRRRRRSKRSRIHCFSIAKCIVIITIFFCLRYLFNLHLMPAKFPLIFFTPLYRLCRFMLLIVYNLLFAGRECSTKNGSFEALSFAAPIWIAVSFTNEKKNLANGNELRNKNVFLTLQRHLWLGFGHEEKYLSSINKLNDFQFSSHSLCRLSHHSLRLHSYLKEKRYQTKTYIEDLCEEFLKILISSENFKILSLSLGIIPNEFQILFMIDSDEMILLVNLSGNISIFYFAVFFSFIMIKFFFVKIDSLDLILFQCLQKFSN